MIISGSIHVAANGISSFFPYDWVIFHRVSIYTTSFSSIHLLMDTSLYAFILWKVLSSLNKSFFLKRIKWHETRAVLEPGMCRGHGQAFCRFWSSLTENFDPEAKNDLVFAERRLSLVLKFSKENGLPFAGSGRFRAIWPHQFTENRPPWYPRLLSTISHHFPQPPGLPSHPGPWLVRVCTQLCPTLCNAMDYNLPFSSVYEIFQARILEWVAVSFSRRSQPRDQAHVSRVSCISRQILYHCTTWEALY